MRPVIAIKSSVLFCSWVLSPIGSCWWFIHSCQRTWSSCKSLVLGLFYSLPDNIVHVYTVKLDRYAVINCISSDSIYASDVILKPHCGKFIYSTFQENQHNCKRDMILVLEPFYNICWFNFTPFCLQNALISYTLLVQEEMESAKSAVRTLGASMLELCNGAISISSFELVKGILLNTNFYSAYHSQ